MNLFLFIIVLIVSFIVVRIGAVAFQLTGLEWSLAKFQALSCFTGTGFTTRESELVVSNQQRRKIASVLIVLGHAGFVTMIAAFANTLRTNIAIPHSILPFLDTFVPVWLLPWTNLMIIVSTVYIVYRLFTNAKIANKLTNTIRSGIAKRDIIKPVTFSELAIATGGYGVSQIEVCKNSPLLNKSLLESDLRKNDITVLAIEREGIAIPNPKANTVIVFGDRLTCFGKLGDIRRKVCVT
ncbi:MAG: hypothetical protein KJ706_01785 [Candidatus Omnitrophica bacterium]|nr:hypothetical protein [Candidatus Omnitrophota bacterium]MBU4590916.1 hypothetical protein [Candidatus Omnitrophota bacterium]